MLSQALDSGNEQFVNQCIIEIQKGIEEIVGKWPFIIFKISQPFARIYTLVNRPQLHIGKIVAPVNSRWRWRAC